MIPLRFFIAVPNWRTAVFCLESKRLEKWQSDFLALRSLTILDADTTSIGLLSVIPFRGLISWLFQWWFYTYADHHMCLHICINFWCSLNIYVCKERCLFSIGLLQWFKFLSRGSNIKNIINNFIWCYWFGTLCCMLFFLIIWKQRYYFPYYRSVIFLYDCFLIMSSSEEKWIIWYC